MSIPPKQFAVHDAVDRLRADLRLRRLDPLWAKLEIFLGLLAVGGGLLLGVWSVTRHDVDFVFAAVALMLFVLGGYLGLAGSRSHLYQSNNMLAAYLADMIRHDKMKQG